MKTNLIARAIIETLGGNLSFLDSKNILWKMVDGEWIGKKAVRSGNGNQLCWEGETESMAI